MPATYRVIEKSNPQDPQGLRKFYPSYASNGRVSQRELANRAADISTLSTADMAAAVEALLTLIPRLLAEGNIVDLGDFGRFHLAIEAEGADTATAVNRHHIKKVNARFTPGKEFKTILKQTEFVKATE